MLIVALRPYPIGEYGPTKLENQPEDFIEMMRNMKWRPWYFFPIIEVDGVFLWAEQICFYEEFICPKDNTFTIPIAWVKYDNDSQDWLDCENPPFFGGLSREPVKTQEAAEIFGLAHNNCEDPMHPAWDLMREALWKSQKCLY